MKRFVYLAICLLAGCGVAIGATVDVPLHEFEANQGYATAYLSNVQVTNGCLQGECNGNDPQVKIQNITSSYDAVFPTEIYNKIEIRMFVDAAATGDAVLFWGTTLEPGFSGTRSISFNTTKGAWGVYTIDVGSHIKWTGDLNDIRIDPFPAGNVGKTVKIDSIRLLSSTPGLATLNPTKMSVLWRKLGGGADYTTVTDTNSISDPHDGQIAYIADATSAFVQPLYRHYRSTSPSDHMDSLQLSEPGYSIEGILGYTFTNSFFGNSPLIRQINGSMHGTVHFYETLPGYTDDAGLGYAYGRCNKSGTNAADFYTVTGGDVTLTCNPAAGGAIWGWTWGGMQFVNNYDLGRQLQSWILVSNSTRCPGEAGANIVKNMSNFYLQQGSINVCTYTAGGTLVTRTIPVENNPTNFPLWGGDTNHTLVYTDFVLGKEVTLNYRGLGPVAKYVMYMSLPKKSVGTLPNYFYGLDMHLNNNFTKCYKYDPTLPATNALTLLDVQPSPATNFNCLISNFVYCASICATEDGNYAFGFLVKDIEDGGSFPRLTIRNNIKVGGNDEYSAGTMAQTANNPIFTIGAAGSSRKIAYFISGTLETVQIKIRQLYAVRDELEW